MKLNTILLATASLCALVHCLPRAGLSPVTREGSSLMVNGKRWRAVGPNIYWLGLDENVIPPAGEPFYAPTNSSYPTKERITEMMATVKALGGTMIRGHTLGVSVGNPLSVMPEAGVVNEEAFETIDWAVYQAGQYGVRLLIPLVDNYDYYHGGKYVFLRWGGFNITQSDDDADPAVQQFYTNGTIVAMFKDYIAALLTHQNAYTGLTYAEDPTIFAYESGNELNGPSWGDMDVPAEWTRDIARFVKELAPQKLFMDGTYGINKTHLDIDEVDLYSDHFYPLDLDKLRSGVQAVADAGKVYSAGEYDWVGESGGDSMQAFFQAIEDSPAVGGDQFWSLFGHNAPDCSVFVNHTDGFTMQYGNPENSAHTNSRIELIRKHFVNMSEGRNIGSNATLPAVPCPAPVFGGAEVNT
ncbi:glycoside hydrolase superfamily [Xylariomycetidae sp. FL0641]|nr:glycoside hydrolase superfamily [Xylariomycetidae sp. FL0641]